MTSPLSKVINLALLSAVYELLEEDLREKAVAKEREEAARWERRRQAVFDTIDRALMVDHSKHYVSNATKATMAARLRDGATQYSQRRSEALMRMTEEQASRFERYGTC